VSRAILGLVVDQPDALVALLRALREETGCADVAYAHPPSRIPSGHETDVYALALRGGPAGFDGPLIARCLREATSSRAASLEAAVHEGLHAQGFPVPRVLVARDAAPAFVLMERLPGRSMAEGVELEQGPLERLGALANLARVSVRLPKLLGEVTRRLLDLETEPLLRAMEARKLPPEAIGFDRHLERFAERVECSALSGHEAGLRWLQQARPPDPERLAICHGDLAPNLLFEGARVAGVIDWSSAFATLADPAFEIANTRIMLQVPLPVPRSLQWASEAYQRGLARRFASALGRGWTPDAARLRYYEAWRCFLALLGAAELWRACTQGAPVPERPDPWSIPEIATRVAAAFRTRTGVAIDLPPPPRAMRRG
jgi:aminoglycoside phosphotransferase (APT) family kinase protein